MRVVSAAGLGLAIALGIGAPLAAADEPTKINLTLKDHKFAPAEPTAPAGKPITIEVSNLELHPFRIREQDPAGGKARPGGREGVRPGASAESRPLPLLR